VLAIVVPCYNEQEVFPETSRRLAALLARLVQAGAIAPASRAWYVDDGSRDRTWALIHAASLDPAMRCCGLRLSRNRGHQVALLAGLMTATGDALVSVDADLQDDLEVIPTMVDRFRAGDHVVYGVRRERDTDTRFKRLTAEGYYRLLERLGVEIVFNHADYRLLSRRAVEALRSYPESNLFLRALVTQLGFRSSSVEYARHERFAGESKYPLRKMLALAWQGVTSFSTAPLRLITGLGAVVSVLSLGLGAWALFVRLFTEAALPGWASIVIPLFLLSGVQLLSLGMIGEYLAKVFVETKRRPLYFIDQFVQAVPAVEAAEGHAFELPARAASPAAPPVGT
jgi:glycosyltransferase involved in cell wall biosynthesis